jgi:hypothetical protein
MPGQVGPKLLVEPGSIKNIEPDDQVGPGFGSTGNAFLAVVRPGQVGL